MVSFSYMNAETDVQLVEEVRSAWFIPGAIIFAGIILAASVYYVRATHILGTPAGDVAALPAVTQGDHRIGNPTAPVMIVEYGDIDSTYAKSFQATMEQIMTEYAPGGKVAWVYRHFPLIDQHQYSEMHAEAAECASSLGKEHTFWNFIDLLQARAPASQQFDPRGYDDIVRSLGLDVTAFESCMTAHTYRTRVANDISGAIAIGATGSPYTVVIVKGQKAIPIEGSLPYEAMKKIIQQSIAKAK